MSFPVNMILPYAMAIIVGFVNMSIVDSDSNNTCENSDSDSELYNSIDNKYPEYNIYEKIQILIYLSQYSYILPNINQNKDIMPDNNKIKSIPIPKKRR